MHKEQSLRILSSSMQSPQALHGAIAMQRLISIPPDLSVLPKLADLHYITFLSVPKPSLTDQLHDPGQNGRKDRISDAGSDPFGNSCGYFRIYG